MSSDDILKGDFDNMSFSADPGVLQMYVLRNTIEIKVRLQTIQEKQLEIAELVQTGVINDQKVQDQFNRLNEAILELVNEEFHDCLAHAASSGKNE
jgi:hypothetical protein